VALTANRVGAGKAVMDLRRDGLQQRIPALVVDVVEALADDFFDQVTVKHESSSKCCAELADTSRRLNTPPGLTFHTQFITSSIAGVEGVDHGSDESSKSVLSDERSNDEIVHALCLGAQVDVEHREGGYWVAGTRVSLASLVYACREGQTAESLAQSFPVLTLEHVYGAIAYYLAHRATIDAYLIEQEAALTQLQQDLRQQDPILYQKLADARRQCQTTQA
jgi:uncharacterized protein (DUF433 family)